MLVHPTRDLLTSLGLHGMAKAFQDLEAQPEAVIDHVNLRGPSYFH